MISVQFKVKIKIFMHQQIYSVIYFDLSFKDWKDTGLITLADQTIWHLQNPIDFWTILFVK